MHAAKLPCPALLGVGVKFEQDRTMRRKMQLDEQDEVREDLGKETLVSSWWVSRSESIIVFHDNNLGVVASLQQ